MFEVLHGHLMWLGSGILFAIALLWAAASTQSLFEVRYRLWRLMRSGHEISNEKVREAIQERADFMAFRALLTWADTPGEMKRILGFATKHDLEPGILGDCGPYFHRQNLSIKDKVPALDKAKLVYLVARLIFLLISVLGACVLIQPRVLVSFKDDGTRALLGAHEATLFGPDQLFLVPDECPKTNTGAAGFNAIHTKVLCNVFGSKGFQLYIDDALTRQRMLGALLLVFSAAGYTWCRRRFQQVRAAHAIRNWLVLREKTRDQQKDVSSSSSSP